MLGGGRRLEPRRGSAAAAPRRSRGARKGPRTERNGAGRARRSGAGPRLGGSGTSPATRGGAGRAAGLGAAASAGAPRGRAPCPPRAPRRKPSGAPWGAGSIVGTALREPGRAAQRLHTGGCASPVNALSRLSGLAWCRAFALGTLHTARGGSTGWGHRHSPRGLWEQLLWITAPTEPVPATSPAISAELSVYHASNPVLA